MRNNHKWLTVLTAGILATSILTGCGSTAATTETTAADATATTETTESTDAAQDATATAGVDLNSMTVDEIAEKAKAEGEVVSVGMPDSWANWGQTWTDLKDKYGIEHNDTDMSSAEELQMFATEGENGTKDIGDVGQAFGPQAVEQDLVQAYKTSNYDDVADWAKDKEGKWMIAYAGVTTFLTNTDSVATAPTSWADIAAGDYKVAIGDINGGNAQAAVIASAYANGGDLNNLDPAFEYWTKLAEAGRINTLDITEQNFETGEVEMGVVWSFTGVPYKNNITQYALATSIPSDGAIMSGYASVINKNAPHPYAAALAREYIFSDEGQANLAQSGAIPTRKSVEIPKEIQDVTFQPAEYADAVPMSDTEAYTAACATVVERWQSEIIPLLVQ